MTSTDRDLGPPGSVLSFDVVLAVLLELRQEFEIGVDQVLAVERLMVRLAILGKLPLATNDLIAFVGPIICRTREEQLAFPSRFHAVLRRVLQSRSVPEPPTPETKRRPPIDVRRLRRRRNTWLAGVAGVIALSGALVVNETLTELTGVGSSTTKQTATPDAGAPAKPPPSASSANPPPAGHPPHDGPPTGAASATPLEVDPDTVRQALVPLAPEDEKRLLLRLAVTFVGLFLLAFALLRLRAWAEAKRFLARTEKPLPSTMSELEQRIERPAPDAGSTRVLARQLRAREIVPATELDMRASVAATVRAVGEPTAVYRPRMRAPDYLALVERRSLHDIQAAVFEDWLTQLQKQDVSIERRYFSSDASVLLRSGERDAETWAATQAATPEHRLLVFSDGEPFVEQLFGRVRGWVCELSWQHRALVTPEQASHWGSREAFLAESGMRVVPATSAGLAATRSEQPSQLGLPPERNPSSPFPRLVVENWRAWQHEDAPAERDVTVLLSEVRAYLGDRRYRWFAACALYPQLRWELVVALGDRLFRSGDPPRFDAEGLLRMSRLPWMRAAFMPDWLRVALLESLDRPELLRVRRALYEVLAAAASPGNRALVLELGRDDLKPLGEVVQRAFDNIEKETPLDRVKDRVFTTWKDDGTGLRIPAHWLRRAGAFTDYAKNAPAREAATIVEGVVGWLLVIVPIYYVCLTPAVAELLTLPFGVTAALLVAFRVSGSLASVLRWFRPEQKPQWIGLRMASTSACTMVLLVAVSTYVPLKFLRAQAYLLILVPEVISLVIVCATTFFLTKLREGGMTVRTLGTLGRLADAVMPDRLFFDRRHRRGALAPAPLFQTVLAALLLGPCTWGFGVPLYSATLVFRYSSGPRLLVMARSLFEISLCWLSLLLGRSALVDLADVELAPFDTTAAIAIGWGATSLACAMRILAPPPGSRPKGTAIVPWRTSLMSLLKAAGGFVDRWAPDRWITIHPRIVPIAACVIGAWAASTWEPTAKASQLGLTVFGALGWRTAPVVTSSGFFTMHEMDVVHAVFSPDGTLVASASVDGKVKVSDANTLGTFKSMDSLTGSVVAFTPDGTKLETGGTDGIVHEYYLQSAQPPWSHGRFQGKITALAVGPDSAKIAHGYDDGAVRIWSQNTGLDNNFELQGGTASIEFLQFSPDGGRIVAAEDSGRVVSWKVDGTDFVPLPVSLEAGVPIAASHDGTRLVTGTRSFDVHVYRADKGPTVTLQGHTSTITCVAFSSDGSKVVSGSDDGSARIWNSDGSGVAIEIHEPQVTTVAFNPAGTRVVTGSRIGIVRVWDVFRSPVRTPQTATMASAGKNPDAGGQAKRRDALPSNDANEARQRIKILKAATAADSRKYIQVAEGACDTLRKAVLPRLRPDYPNSEVLEVVESKTCALTLGAYDKTQVDEALQKYLQHPKNGLTKPVITSPERYVRAGSSE